MENPLQSQNLALQKLEGGAYAMLRQLVGEVTAVDKPRRSHRNFVLEPDLSRIDLGRGFLQEPHNMEERLAVCSLHLCLVEVLLK